MYRKIMYSDFQSVGNVLDSVIKNSQLQAGLKKSTLSKFWHKIVGKKFENLSRLHSLNQNNVLIVACANSFVTSELLMFKNDILKKLEPYSKSLDLNITDIIFSHKIWTVEKEDPEEEIFEEKILAADIDYDSITLDKEDLLSIKNCVDNNKFASEEQRERMFEAIVKDLKYQKFINSNNN